MEKAIYMCIHYPCVFILALQEWWWMHKDSITSLARTVNREIRSFIRKAIPEAFKFEVCLAVTAPLIYMFMLMFIKLS